MNKQKLYIFIGYPGAGKTTIAKLIEETTGAMHIWTDQERQLMFEKPTHTASESNQLYTYLNERTGHLLDAGRSVIFDTNFNHKIDREHLREIAKKHGAETITIWVNTDIDIARERAVHAQVLRNGYDFLMSKEQFDEIAAKLEVPDESEIVIKMDGFNIDPGEIKRLLDL